MLATIGLFGAHGFEGLFPLLRLSGEVLLADASRTLHAGGAKARHSPGPPGDCLLDRDDNTDRLGEITCPAIVFHGTADVSIEIDKAEALCRALYGCTGVVRVERAPHASNLAHPEQVNGALLEFLRSVD